MLNVLDVVFQIGFGVALTAWVVRRDMRRLDPKRLARGWNTASFWSAVVGFGPLCIPVHFARTRRTILGLGLGLVWGVAVLVVLSGVSEGLAAVFGGR